MFAVILQTFNKDLLGARHLDAKKLQEKYFCVINVPHGSTVTLRLRGGTWVSRRPYGGGDIGSGP